MNCPNKTHPTWKYLVDNLGEKKSFSIFVANGYMIPSQGNAETIVNKFNNSYEGVVLSGYASNEEAEITKIEGILAKATSNYNTIDTEIIETGKKWTKDPVTGDYLHEDTGSKLMSVHEQLNSHMFDYTDSVTAINKLVDELYGDDEVSTKKNSDFVGEFTKAEAKAKYMERYNQTLFKGNAVELMLDLALSSDEQSRQEIVNKFSALKDNLPDFLRDITAYEWIYGNSKNIKTIFERMNFKGLKFAEDPDKILKQVVLVSEALGIAGTADYIINKGDNLYRIVDLKAGSQLLNESTSKLLKHGRLDNVDLYQSSLTKAKLQLTYYMILHKIQNPEAKYEGLNVLWLPSKWSLKNPADLGLDVDIRQTLQHIEKFLKNENPEMYEKFLNTNRNVFKPEYYTGVDTREAAENITDPNVLKQIELDIVQELAFENPGGIVDHSKVVRNFDKWVKLKPDIIATMDDLKGAKDMSIAYYIGSISYQKNPYIKIWQQVLEDGLLDVSKDYNRKEAIFNHIMRKILVRYMKNSGESTPVLKNSLNLLGKGVFALGAEGASKVISSLDSNILNGWAFVEDSTVKEYPVKRLALTEQELLDNAKLKEFSWILESPGKVAPEFMQMLNFLNDFYGSVLDTERTDSFANETATKKPFGSKMIVKTQMDIINSSTNRKGTPFKYYKGFFPKHAKQKDEFGQTLVGKLMSKQFYKNLYRNYFTRFNEMNYEEYRNTSELIPLAGLGSDAINNTENYSMSLEHQFKSFAKSFYFKKHMTKGYAVGEAIRFKLDSLGTKRDPYLPLVNKWIESQLTQLLKNRLGDLPEAPRSAVITSSNEGVNFSVSKFLGSVATATSSATLGLQYSKAFRNLLSINMNTVKESVLNDLLSSGKGVAKGFDKNFYSFGTTELAKGIGTAMGIQVDGMKGDLKKNKTWNLMMQLNYQPSISPFRPDDKYYVTGSSGIFTPTFLYYSYSLAEEVLCSSVFKAQMDHIKVDKPGHPFHGMSAYDLYEQTMVTDPVTGVEYAENTWKLDPLTGKPFVRGIIKDKYGNAVELTELTGAEISSMKFAYERMNGGYSTLDRTLLETNVLGRALIQFKRYLPSIIMNNINVLGENKTLGYYGQKTEMMGTDGKPLPTEVDENGNRILQWNAKVTEGRWLTLLGWTLNKFHLHKLGSKLNVFKEVEASADSNKAKGYKALSQYEWKNLNQQQKENLVDGALTVGSFLIMKAMHLFMFGGVPEDNKIRRFIQILLSNYSQQWNPIEQGREVMQATQIPSFMYLSKLIPAIQTTSLAVLLSAVDGSDLEQDLGLDIEEKDYLTKDGDLRGRRDLFKRIPGFAAAQEHIDLYRDYNNLEFNEDE